MATTQNPRPFDVEYIENPSQDECRKLALANTPAVIETGVGSVDKLSRNKARMAKYTYVIDTDGSKWNCNSIEPAKAKELIARQEAYIKEAGKMIAVDAYVGLGEKAYGATWLYAPEAANIAGMQQILAFPREDVETAEQLAEPFKPTFKLIYTPNLMIDDMPGRQVILVDLENYVTYVMGPDYFGESKKGVLRMLCHLVYEQGGLVLHAGAKAVTKKGGEKLTVTVMGLSGTGKTTTTFSKQGDLTEPIQDDMVVLWPKGDMSITENGCFAKIDGLNEAAEPIIYRGSVSKDAWLENAFVEADGTFDFYKGAITVDDARRLRDLLVLSGADAANLDKFIAGEVKAEEVIDDDGITADGWDFVKWTGNGRSIIPMSSVPGAADLHNIPEVKSMGILNRDEGADAATPGIVRFTSPEQAAGYFMLGETSKTSAAGKERGKTRSPFTQPFFPGLHGLQAKRFAELAATTNGVTMWLMNTGYVGGDAKDVKNGVGLKVKIRHSSAMLEALLAGDVKWTKDEDFGYEVVDVDAPENAELVSKVPVEILQPKRYYEKEGRTADYQAWVKSMNDGRKQFLESFEVAPEIVAATVLG